MILIKLDSFEKKREKCNCFLSFGYSHDHKQESEKRLKILIMPFPGYERGGKAKIKSHP